MDASTDESDGRYLPRATHLSLVWKVHPYLYPSHTVTTTSAHLHREPSPPLDEPSRAPKSRVLSLVSLPLVSIADRCVSSAALASGYPNAREAHPKSNASWTCSHAPVPSCRAVDQTCLTEVAFSLLPSRKLPRTGDTWERGHGWLTGIRPSGVSRHGSNGYLPHTLILLPTSWPSSLRPSPSPSPSPHAVYLYWAHGCWVLLTSFFFHYTLAPYPFSSHPIPYRRSARTNEPRLPRPALLISLGPCPRIKGKQGPLSVFLAGPGPIPAILPWSAPVRRRTLHGSQGIGTLGLGGSPPSRVRCIQ